MVMLLPADNHRHSVVADCRFASAEMSFWHQRSVLWKRSHAQGYTHSIVIIKPRFSDNGNLNLYDILAYPGIEAW